MREILRFFSVICLLLPGVAFAGISGVVKDHNTDETLIGVNIFLNQDNNTVSNGTRGVGTITDVDGRFEIIELPEDAKFIQFSYIGYETQVLSLKDGQVYDVKLIEAKTALEEVVIEERNLEGAICAHDILNHLNASKGVYAKKDSKLYCDIQVCNDNYIEQEFIQTFTYKSGDEEGTTTQYEVCKCPEGFEEACSDSECACNKAQEEQAVVIEEIPNAPTNETPEQSEDDKIQELRDKADAAHERENSMANKMLGAAGIGATGIGGMMLMQGLSEQKADDNAEEQMAAYLSTFMCRYGDGRAKGGESDIELPGANALLPLYSEYVTLANETKAMKTELDLKPGIESESILDNAASGLYDDENSGKTSGAFASLARALQNPDGEDAKKWAEQTEKTSKNVKTGAITAGAGAVGGLVGHIAESTAYKKKAEKGEDDSDDKSKDKKYKPKIGTKR